MLLHINHNYHFTWPKDLIDQPIEQILLKLDPKTIKVTGMIGDTGQKIHSLTLYYENTPRGMGIIAVRSDCGSYKPQSTFRPSTFSLNFERVTCDRCIRQHLAEEGK